jgi:hypothetical protein
MRSSIRRYVASEAIKAPGVKHSCDVWCKVIVGGWKKGVAV